VVITRGTQKGESTSIIRLTSKKGSREFILNRDSRLHETRNISIEDYKPSENSTIATKLCLKKKERETSTFVNNFEFLSGVYMYV
jgi:hypothetical protein